MANPKITAADAAILRQVRADTSAGNEFRDAANSGGHIGPPGIGNGSARFPRPPRDGFWAKVTGSVQQQNDDGDDMEQWAYAIQQVYKKDKGPGKWIDLPGGVTTSSDIDSGDPVAWNTLEDINDTVGSGPTGTGVNTAGLPDNDPPVDGSPALTLQPVTAGAIVWARMVGCNDDDGTGIVEFWFTAPNGVGGSCPTTSG